MEPFKLVSCGLLAMAGLSASLAHYAPAAKAVSAAPAPTTPTAKMPAESRRAVGFQGRPAHGPTYHVTATAYSAVPGQTDDEPFVTADNSTIPASYDSQLHWLALSQDLLRHWGGPFRYGDTVRVSGVSTTLDGVYIVHDTMNRRHRHCLDVLTHPRERFDVFQPGVRLRRVSH